MTQIFLDTANLKEIKKYKEWGIIDGVTTNQKIFLKEKGCNFEKQAKAILEEVNRLPVSLDGPNDYEGIIKAAKEYTMWEDSDGERFGNIVIKVPMLGNGEGLRAVKTLDDEFIQTNVTACMTLKQVFLASNAGATYVSLFYCRMKDWHQNIYENESLAEQYALGVINETMRLFDAFDFKTRLIVGSIRTPEDIENILTVQPDIITIPPKILEQMPFNEMTEKTLKEFEGAWKEFKKHEKK